MLRLAAPSVDVVRRGSSFILTSNHALSEGPRSLGQLLVRWAERAPDRTWLAERSLDGTWRRVTYAEGLARVRAVGNGLLRRKASRARPVIRVKGPNVSPGYWMRSGEIAPAALDEDGFLPTGDAVRFADRERPELGLVFEGRLGENFKLSSGTWVGVGQLRVAIVEACIPLIQDAVIAGQDREELGALLFPAPGKADAEELRLRVLEALRQHNARMPGSSHAIRRAMLMSEPPSLGAGETTDKGYLNQRRCLERRAALVERLFAAEPDAEIIVV